MTRNKVRTLDRKIPILEKKKGSNFNIGDVTAETLPRRFLSCLSCRLSHAGVCSGDPMTQKILEATIGAVCGKRLAGNLRGDTREPGFIRSLVISLYLKFW